MIWIFLWSMSKRILEKTFTILDFREDYDHDNERAINWYYTLRDIEKEWETKEIEAAQPAETEKVTVEPAKETPHYAYEEDDTYESASDYWKRVAEDSGMTLEEYFNSED